MKLSKNNKNESFYEVFSDLIFATMAIFVLLFIIVALLMKPSDDPSVKQSVEMVVAIDVSGSMEQELTELKTALIELSENFPTIIKQFKVGVIAYSNRFSDPPQGATIFPITLMDDQGVQELKAWLHRPDIKTKGDFIDINKVLTYGAAMLTERPIKGLQTFVLIGDMGPYEINNGVVSPEAGTPNPIKNIEKYAIYEQKGIDTIKYFISQDNRRSFLSMFTGNAFTGRGKRRGHNESKTFFCSLARAAGDHGYYTTSNNKMLWSLLKSVITNSHYTGAQC